MLLGGKRRGRRNDFDYDDDEAGGFGQRQGRGQSYDEHEANSEYQFYESRRYMGIQPTRSHCIASDEQCVIITTFKPTSCYINQHSAILTNIMLY